MQDASCSASLHADSQTELPNLWLHPLHTVGDGPTPCRVDASSRQPTDIQDLVDVAATAVQNFIVAFSLRDRPCHNKHRVSFGGASLIINASANVDNESSWPIPLPFSEVTHFQTQTGTLFLLIAIREMSQQPGMEDFNGPFEKYWVISFSSSDEASPQVKTALIKLLAKIGALGAVRLDLAECYDIAHEPIGTGSCASVYLGRERCPASSTRKEITEQEDRVVAVKIPTAKSSYLAAKEAGFLMGVAKHPNIIGFHGLFKVPDPATEVAWQWAIMMEHCSAGDLNDSVAANGSCSELRSAEIMIGLLSALSHLHSQGIVHRDVKAENILLKDKGRPVLADFGIAAYLDDAQAMTKRCGSPGHCAPEILEEKEYNAKVDVFSSGVVLYFLVSGTLPFRGPGMSRMLRQTLECNVKMDDGYFRLVSSTVKAVIKLFLRKHPKNRPESSAALQQIMVAYGTRLKASSLVTDYATDAPEPADRQLGNSGRPVPDQVAGLSAGVEQSGLQWLSQGRNLFNQPEVGLRRRFPMSSVDSDGKRPLADDASPNNVAVQDHHVGGDTSTTSFGLMLHARPPNDMMRSKSRPVPFLQWCQQVAKHKQTKTAVAHKQEMSPSSRGSEATSEEMRATSARERPSQSWSGKSSNDADGVHLSFGNDMLEDSTPQKMPKESFLDREVPSFDDVRSNLRFPKTPFPRRMRGWWSHLQSGKTGTPRQFQPTCSLSVSSYDDMV